MALAPCSLFLQYFEILRTFFFFSTMVIFVVRLQLLKKFVQFNFLRYRTGYHVDVHFVAFLHSLRFFLYHFDLIFYGTGYHVDVHFVAFLHFLRFFSVPF